MNTVKHYVDINDKDIFADWRNNIADRRAKMQIDRRINRVELGNFGDHKPVGGAIWELRIDVGAGYRVYYALEDTTIVLLLCGGDKSSKKQQQADIATAKDYWQDWQQRSQEE